MGLDNGIVIKNKKRSQLPLWPFRYPFDEDHDEDVSICYWRKCWGIREHTLLEIIRTNDEGEEYPLTVKHVKQIRKLIRSFLKQPDWWESNSIWGYNESKHMLRCDLWNLWWLKWWMRFHRKETVLFYDSF